MKIERSLSRFELRDVDRRAVEEYGLPGIVLMENAGRGAAELLLSKNPHGPVVVCCGGGANGGDGYVIARHLDAAGCDVRIVAMTPPEDLSGDAAIAAGVVRRSGITIDLVPESPDPDMLDGLLAGAEWIIDALLGTGARGAVRPRYVAVIDAINRSAATVLAVDLPSGLDCDTGEPAENCVEAFLTATFVARKTGFDNPAAIPFLGEIRVLDIGAPRTLLEAILRRA